MDAKTRLARPVHRNAAEMFGLVRPDLRQRTAVESVDQGADLVVAVRRHRRNCREPCPVPVRGFHPLASADEEPVGFQVRPETQLLVASADPEQVAPVVKVVDHQAQHWVPRGAVRPATERLAVAKVRPIVVQEVE
jgi:hypothetical protein